MKTLLVLTLTILGFAANATGKFAPPLANAGPDQTIYLTQTTTATLNGSASLGDSYQWTDVSTDYKSGATISSPNSAVTNVTGLKQGTWYYQLAVTSGGVTSIDVVVVRVDYDVPPANSTVVTTAIWSDMAYGANLRNDTSSCFSWSSDIRSLVGKNPNAFYMEKDGTLGSWIDSARGKYYSVILDGHGCSGYGRSELNPARHLEDYIDTSKTYVIEWKGYFPQDFSMMATNAEAVVIGQIHGSDGFPPPYSYNVKNNALVLHETTQGGNGYSGYTKIFDMADMVNQTHTIRMTLKEGMAGAQNFIKIEIDGVQKYFRNTGRVGATFNSDWIKAASLYDFGNAIVSSSNKTRGRRFSMVTESFTVYTLNKSSLPTAYAGADQAITSPLSSVSLSGSGSISGGTISGYNWAKISGPSAGTITSPNTAGTTVTGLVPGTYQFELTVKDNNGNSAKDMMQVTVISASNILPVAKAGSDLTMTLPANDASLSGSGADTDGSISTYQWTKIAGPSSFTIGSANSASTPVSNLVAGIYQFELKVTDNQGGVGKDTVSVTVNPASNVAPSANAGSDKTLILPTNTITLSGSGSDADGSIKSYQWTKVSGPSSYNITNPSSAATDISGLIQGTYQFALAVTDDKGAVGKDTVQVQVNAAANKAPVANAGPAVTINLPVNTCTLNGSGSDADGSVKGYQWVKISGPSAFSIINPASAITDISSLVQGIYLFELTVTDDQGATGKDTVQVTVGALANIPPAANAGTDQAITLPLNSTRLSGSGTDPDGTIKSYQWKKISGPTIFNIQNSISGITDISGLVQGTYDFELTVTDDQGATGKDTVQVMVNAVPNLPPTANAGPGRSLTLPVNSTSLNGSGSDTDGSISSYQWKKISGPSSFNIATPSSAVSGVSGLVQGTYQFELTVTDDQGGTGKDTVLVIVNAAPNLAPVADAGPDRSITLPANAITLNGSGNDADGSIKAYQWSMVSGPASYNIVDETSAVTDLSGLTEGTYLLELSVTDDKGATDQDTVQVVVNLAANIAPIANAGSNKTITLPANATTLTGSGNDPDGSIKSYLWTKVFGPATYNIVDANSPVTDLSGLVQGTYQFQLMVTDDKGATGKSTVSVKVNAASNIPPTASAGTDVTITLPVNTASLTGSGNDPDGSIKSYQWTKISGPSSYNIANATSPVTDISGLAPGTYLFELEVTDNTGDTGQDTVLVEVKAAPNLAPTADAGSDRAITLPLNSTTLTGSGNDPDGSIENYRWTKISGPGSWDIADASSPVTGISGLTKGTYLFELVVTDDKGAKGRDTVQIRVNAAPNLAPSADAGPDMTVVLPVNATTLTGSGNDVDGRIKTYRWTRVSGPTSYNIVNRSLPVTDVSGLVQGLYLFELLVTDDKGATSRDTVQVSVNAAANKLPAANAGADKTITLPVNTATLTGSGNDADGTIKVYQWTLISGPSPVNIVNAKSPVTDVSALEPGVYQFELEVTDDKGATGSDTMQVRVNAASNIAPVANAGSNKTIALPVNTVSLTGSGSDADGTIKSYQWTKISGPSSLNVVNPASPVTDVSAMVQGVYQFELEVTDDKGATDRDTVLVRVNAAANIAPVADAGADKAITLPANSITLNGNGTDQDGTIAGYQWTILSGPSVYQMSGSKSATMSLSGLVQGIYVFELTVSDNKGDTGQDTVLVKVNAAANIAPAANAGPDQSLTLPVSAITLNGSGIDQDGSIKSYSWAKVSGPSSYNIGNSSSASTPVSGLVQGTYQFELTVTDDRGGTGKDIVQVIVNKSQTTTQSTPNIVPKANAGNDTTVVAPVDLVSLKGVGIDPDGSIVGYSWTQISGPSSGTILSNRTANTDIGNLVEGTYSFELEVTDNSGAKGKDTVNITVALARFATGSNSMKVYPNPVHNMATVEISTGKANTNLTIVITDMSGKTVYSEQLVSKSTTLKERINLSYLIKGFYIVTVYYDGIEKQSFKIIRM